jgi:Tfp pilus assembly protein PilF
LVILLLGAASVARADGDIAAARKLWLTGKYAEAQEAFEKLKPTEPVAAAIGIARCQASTGHDAAAAKTVGSALETHRDDADLHALAAQLALDRGDSATADREASAAFAVRADHLLARWVQAERLRLSGKLDEAKAAYEWFVDYYNGHDVEQADDLVIIGRGAAQFARWERLSDQFTFLINELYPAAIEADADYWPAHYEAGLLFLEKYNEPEAARELKAALRINGSAAEVHAALARLALQNYELDDARRQAKQALEINPRQLDALRALADSHLANFETAEAITLLERARKIDPTSEETLGRLAAAYAVVDGHGDTGADTRFAKLADEAIACNPHCGSFYSAVGAAFDLTRKYPSSARNYQVAIERMPQLVDPYGALGLLHMRLGEETEAARLLKQSFEIDPFNVRVNNSLKVLEVLDGYAVLETDHFVIKFDRGKDELLARYAARYLEDEVYPLLTKKFGFEPKDKSLFEFFNRAKNTGGHGWFSARMVGLPYIGTVGACAGKMVAMASPESMPQPFNWARVLKHEFVHVLNLQQSNFNIPHWFTEALAVESEGYPRPQSWNEMLARRVPQQKTFNLDTINLGFVRPRSGEDWQMAYCQAQLYAQYMLRTYGDDALAKMLACYADNLDTRAALKRSFNVAQEDFERGYTAFVHNTIAAMSIEKEKPADAAMSFAELVRAHAEKPDDLDLAARLAEEYVGRKSYAEARKLAEMVLKKREHDPQATVVLARVRLVIGDDAEAMELLKGVVDLKRPDAKSIALLAALELKAQHYQRAAELYETAARTWPDDAQWTKSLARLYLKTGDNKSLAKVLERLADADADDFVIRKKLAYMALDAKDYAGAARWATDALHVNVVDGDVHRLLGESLVGQKRYRDAIDEYKTAVELDAKQPAWRWALADACLQAGDTAQARTALKQLLELHPKYPGASLLLESLDEESSR